PSESSLPQTSGLPIAADIADDCVGARIDSGGGQDAARLHSVTGDAVVHNEIVAGRGRVQRAAAEIDAGFENFGIGGDVIAAEVGGVLVAVRSVEREEAVACDGVAGTD